MMWSQPVATEIKVDWRARPFLRSGNSVLGEAQAQYFVVFRYRIAAVIDSSSFRSNLLRMKNDIRANGLEGIP